MQEIYDKLLQISDEAYTKCIEKSGDTCENCPLAKIIISREPYVNLDICDLLVRI